MLRKILMSTVLIFGAMGAASAADLPSTKAPPAYMPPPPMFTWTGLYIGGQMGYMWGDTGALGYNASGVVGGAHLGYNYQMGQFVAGLEGDVNGSSYSGASGPFGISETVDGSIRGRLGLAWDRALLYATGGAAFVGLNNTYPTPLGGTLIPHTRVGWTIGGGVEYAIDNNWSVRAEYRYTDYGTYIDHPYPLKPTTAFSTHDTDNRVQIGFSYKFDMFAPPGPVVARY